MARLSRHNEVKLIQVFDPLEQQLPVQGYFRITDGETEVQINASDVDTKQNYHQRFAQHRDYLKDLCRKNRAGFMSVSTDQAVLEALTRQGSA